MSFKIPHIWEAIANFLETDKGKEVLIDYVKENNLWDEKLIKELKEYDQKNSAGGACAVE